MSKVILRKDNRPVVLRTSAERNETMMHEIWHRDFIEVVHGLKTREEPHFAWQGKETHLFQLRLLSVASKVISTLLKLIPKT